MYDKKSLQMFTKGSAMPSVDIAVQICRDLIATEMRGPGDVENAMRRLESKYGLSYSFLHSLRYRPPADILLSSWANLIAAYDLECARQQRLYGAERERMKVLANATNKTLVCAADALAGVENP